MADSQDRRGGAKGDRQKSGSSDARDAGDAQRQAETPAAAPHEQPRRPRLYGYDPDYWPELR